MPAQPSLEKTTNVMEFRLPPGKKVVSRTGHVAIRPDEQPNESRVMTVLLGDPRSARRRAIAVASLLGSGIGFGVCAKPSPITPQRAPHGGDVQPQPVAEATYAPDVVCSSVDRSPDIQRAIATIIQVDPSEITQDSCEPDDSTGSISRGFWHSTETNDGRNIGIWLDNRLDFNGQDQLAFCQEASLGDQPIFQAQMDGDGNQTFWRPGDRQLKVFPKDNPTLVLNVQFTGGEALTETDHVDATTLGQYLVNSTTGFLTHTTPASLPPTPDR